MDESNWRSDHALDAGAVRALVREQLPQLAAETVELLGEGWDSTVFEVDGRWVLRFPKRADVVERLALERALLPRLAPALPIAIPRFELFGEPCEGFDYPFVGYEKLPGVPAQLCLDLELTPAAESALARQLGELIGALHRFHVTDAGVTLPQHSLDYLDRPIAETQERLPHLRAESPALAERLERFLATRVAPRRPSDRCVLCHADLDLEHILIDPESGRATGIIDWGDMGLAPPGSDFVALIGWRGPAFVAEALRAYGGDADEGDMEWLRQRAIHVALGNLTYGRLGNRAPYLRAGLATLERMLPPTAPPAFRSA